MVAFEIKINGKKRCVAGLDEVGDLTATLSWNDQNATHQKLWFNVGGVTGERGKSDRVMLWLDERFLRIGDRISIRIVETQTADPPERISGTKRSSRRTSRTTTKTRP
jgi:hypothetical protein